MANAPDLELVSYERPPVEEVAFAVQFAEPAFSFQAIAEFQRRLSQAFPISQPQPPLPRMRASDAEAHLAVRVGYELPRMWFVADDGFRLVQAQEDRLAFNWRKLGSPSPYPRYPQLRSEFAEHLATTRELVGDVVIDFCELTYINELSMPGASEGRLTPLAHLLRPLAPLGDDAKILKDEPLDQRWSATWSISGSGGTQAGRLDVAAEPVVRQVDHRPVYLLTMTARIPRVFSSDEAAMEGIDLAHEWIVRGFSELTTTEMHRVWGRTK